MDKFHGFGFLSELWSVILLHRWCMISNVGVRALIFEMSEHTDDEDSWINLNFDDLRGFIELWQCARVVPKREFKRVKLRSGVLGSPVPAAVSSSSTSSTVVRTAPLVPSASEATHNENQQYYFHE